MIKKFAKMVVLMVVVLLGFSSVGAQDGPYGANFETKYCTTHEAKISCIERKYLRQGEYETYSFTLVVRDFRLITFISGQQYIYLEVLPGGMMLRKNHWPLVRILAGLLR